MPWRYPILQRNAYKKVFFLKLSLKVKNLEKIANKSKLISFKIKNSVRNSFFLLLCNRVKGFFAKIGKYCFRHSKTMPETVFYIFLSALLVQGVGYGILMPWKYPILLVNAHKKSFFP
jgi:hypothetical protein